MYPFNIGLRQNKITPYNKQKLGYKNPVERNLFHRHSLQIDIVEVSKLLKCPRYAND
jgi:hypothetical protein